MIQKEIKRYLFKLRLKMAVEKLIKSILFYLLILATLSLIIISYAKFFVLANYVEILTKLANACFYVFIFELVFNFPRFKTAVKVADELYFKESLITALEFKDDITDAVIIQRQDTLKKMKSTRVEQLYKIRFNKRLAMIILVLFVLNVGVNSLETSQGIKNNIASQNIQEIKEEKDELKKAITEDLSKLAVDKEILDEVLKGLDKNLDGLEKKEEALKALAMTKNELLEKLDKEDLEKIESALKKIDASQKKLAGESISDFAFNEEKKIQEMASEKEGGEKSSANASMNQQTENKDGNATENSNNQNADVSNSTTLTASNSNTSQEAGTNANNSNMTESNANASSNNESEGENSNAANNGNKKAGKNQQAKAGNQSASGNGSANSGTGQGKGKGKGQGNCKGQGSGG